MGSYRIGPETQRLTLRPMNAGDADAFCCTRDGEHTQERGLVGCASAGRGENRERPAKVQYLHSIENEDCDANGSHVVLCSAGCGELPVCSRSTLG